MAFLGPAVQELQGRCKALDKRLAALEQQSRAQDQQIRDLQLYKSQKQQEAQKRNQHVLLAEAARKFSALVEDFVFQGEDIQTLMPPPLQEFPRLRDAGKLTTAQTDRWLQVVRLAPVDLTESKLVQTDRLLRHQGCEAGHSLGQQMQVSMQTIKQWASTYIETRALQPVLQYLELLNMLSSTNQPLCPDKTIADIIQ